MLATLHSADVGLVGWLLVFVFIALAGYAAYLGNVVATILLLVVAVFAAILLA